MVGPNLTVFGAVHASQLSPQEKAIARTALAKLGLSGADQVHGGSGSDSVVVGSGNSTLLGAGSSTAISAVASTKIGNDTLVSGSAHSIIKDGLGKSPAHSLSGDTIKVAGHTAASLAGTTKTSSHAGASTTISMSEKTTVTLVGIKTVTHGKPH
jgi:Ca2+-binding RTX toxin-like protein